MVGSGKIRRCAWSPGGFVLRLLVGNCAHLSLQASLADGVPLDVVDEYGSTAFMLAAYSNKEAAAEFLLDAKANVNETDKGGFGPLRQVSSASVFNRTSRNVRPYAQHAHNGHLQGLTFLLEHRADPNLLDLHSAETPLHLAVERKNPDCARKLLEVCNAQRVKCRLFRVQVMKKH